MGTARLKLTAFLATMICCSALAVVTAQENKAAEAPLTVAEHQQVKGLIAALGHRNFRERERAFQSLLPFGMRIQKDLRQALKHPDLEVRLRIQTILSSLPSAMRLQVVDLSPTLLSLNADALSIEQVIAVLERQSKLVFQRPLAIPAKIPITLDLDQRPLFEVLDQISLNTGHRWYRKFGGGEVLFGRIADERRPMVRYQGPLRIALASISRNAALHFGSGKSESCYVQGQVDIEPGAAVLGAWLPPLIEVALDDQGRKLLPDKTIAANFTPIVNRPSFHFSTALKPPERDAKKIAKLKGAFEVAVAQGYRQVVLSLGREGGAKEIQVKGLRVRLIANVLQKDERTLTFEIQGEPFYADESRKYPVQDQIVEFLDAGGESVETLAPIRRNRQGELDIIVARLPRLEIHDIRVRSLAMIARRKIEFEFENIPLP